MNDVDALTARFEDSRDHLRAVAYRMLGSSGEADDAVQETWLRLHRTDVSAVDNLRGWLTTVVSRLCLDLLRSRSSRREDTGDPGTVAGDAASDRPGPEQEAALADAVGGALLVVLERLTPPERVAFVLHDLFGVGFDEIARTVDRTPAAARQLASRARRRVRGSTPLDQPDLERQRRVVDAFLRAARDGVLDELVAVLAPDVVFRADAAAAALADGPARVVGATAVAATFAGRARAARAALIDGSIGVVVAPGGRLVVILEVTIEDGRIVGIDAVADPERLDTAELAVFED